MTDLKFGTSGLRGLAAELNGPPASSYTWAFLDVMARRGSLSAGGAVCVGRDLRSSSPAIARIVLDTIAAAGFQPIDCGAVPTPALSLKALKGRMPAIMVTGSHIPDDRNGLKFYRPDGEIDKSDEQAILASHDATRFTQASGADARSVDPMPDYRRRYTDVFAADSLAGMRIGVYQHSTVLRDTLVEVLEALGAETSALGRADSFVAVDTEAVSEADVAALRRWAKEGAFDAIVSSDGDGDRPLVADEHGEVVRGDALGAIAAKMLGASVIVTPMTSNSALELNGFGVEVRRTAVGSPFVIAGMVDALEAGSGPVVGFEANGGLILGSAVLRDGIVLSALPTRDALLPILCCLAAMREGGKPLSALNAGLGFRHARSGRLRDIPQAASTAFLARLHDDLKREIKTRLGAIASVDTRDGVRLLASDGSMVYFRASGNAPELRCYVEAPDGEGADALLAWGLAFAARQIKD